MTRAEMRMSAIYMLVAIACFAATVVIVFWRR